MIIHICSRRKNGVKRLEEYPVEYVGRGSPLGNPFRLEIEADRSKVVEQYKVWLIDKLNEKDFFVCREFVRIVDRCKKYGGINLECWCAPKKCHAGVIKELMIKVLQ